jgi:hypothetical protein
MCQNKRQVLLLREPAGNIFVISQLDPYKFEHFFFLFFNSACLGESY